MSDKRRGTRGKQRKVQEQTVGEGRQEWGECRRQVDWEGQSPALKTWKSTEKIQQVLLRSWRGEDRAGGGGC